MATFTFRIPDSMAGRLSSAEMRAWLSQFLRSPYFLPGDPGSGSERISLTLPRDQVENVARYLGCSPSVALRRLAGLHLGVRTAPRVACLSAVAPGATQGPPRPQNAGYRPKRAHDMPAPTPDAGETADFPVVQIVIFTAVIGALFFFGTRLDGG